MAPLVAGGMTPAAALAALAGAPIPGAKPVTKLPPPLILDEQGREVDAAGNPIERPAEAQAQAPGADQQQQQEEEDPAKWVLALLLLLLPHAC